MTTFHLESDRLDAPAVFKFNSSGILTAFEAGTMSDEQLTWLHKHMPSKIGYIHVLKQQYGCRIVEVSEALSFETFFQAYSRRYGERVDRKKTEMLWNRMSKASQTAAYEFIDRYFVRCKRLGIAPKMAKTYLNQEPWKD